MSIHRMGARDHVLVAAHHVEAAMKNLTQVLQLRQVLASALLMTGATMVLADPPPHAPAHGWRAKHDSYYVGYTGTRWPRDYEITSGRCNREEVGAVLGGVVGGTIGHEVAKPEDRVVATILGAAVGALVGSKIGRELDERDEGCVGQSLELAQPGQAVQWRNDQSGVTYVLTPTDAKQLDGRNCRVFKLRSSAAGKSQTVTRTGCQMEQGQWEIR
jgi:surface antigen